MPTSLSSSGSSSGSSLIRTKADFYAKGWAALELGSALGIFFLGTWLGGLGPEQGPLLRVVSVGLSFVAAVFLPAFLFGRPKFLLIWTLNGDPIASEQALPFVDLRHSGRTEIGFTVTVRTSYSSLLGRAWLAHAVKSGMCVAVRVNPPGIVRVKHQKKTPGTRLTDLRDVPEIQIDIREVVEDSSQGRFDGSFVPGVMHSGKDQVEVTARLRRPDADSVMWWANIVPGIKGFDVRR
jgi:hypothetical protein